jgi:hypothetical protein
VNSSISPPFCNIVERGSSVDITTGSLATAVQERHIKEAGVDIGVYEGNEDGSLIKVWEGQTPSSDPDIESDYGLTLTGSEMHLPGKCERVHQLPCPGGKGNLYDEFNFVPQCHQGPGSDVLGIYYGERGDHAILQGPALRLAPRPAASGDP